MSIEDIHFWAEASIQSIFHRDEEKIEKTVSTNRRAIELSCSCPSRPREASFPGLKELKTSQTRLVYFFTTIMGNLSITSRNEI